jgi:hypothetical protein
MNYEKYTRERFDALGLDSPEARALADQLQDDVCTELHSVILPKFQEIVSRLNARGHNLTPCDPIEPGVIAYRDEPTEGECRLRLACDTVVSAGYAHMISAKEYADMISAEEAQREPDEECTE